MAASSRPPPPIALSFGKFRKGEEEEEPFDNKMRAKRFID